MFKLTPTLLILPVFFAGFGSLSALAATKSSPGCASVGSCKQARVCSTRPECARIAAFGRRLSE